MHQSIVTFFFIMVLYLFISVFQSVKTRNKSSKLQNDICLFSPQIKQCESSLPNVEYQFVIFKKSFTFCILIYYCYYYKKNKGKAIGLLCIRNSFNPLHNFYE